MSLENQFLAISMGQIHVYTWIITRKMSYDTQDLTISSFNSLPNRDINVTYQALPQIVLHSRTVTFFKLQQVFIYVVWASNELCIRFLPPPSYQWTSEKPFTVSLVEVTSYQYGRSLIHLICCMALQCSIFQIIICPFVSF